MAGLFLTIILTALLSATAQTASAVVGQPSVTIANGVIIGTTTTVSSATAAVTKYIGVPFALSPPLRFAPPEAAPSWTTPLQAVATRPACIQQFNGDPSSTMREKTIAIFNNPGGPPLPESEDCLYLNIYVPPNTTSTSQKSVMFWIFGGNLQFGSGGLLIYDGSSFAYNQDVIIVTVNYRTNVFGFSNSPGIPINQQNAGFFDQRFALSWVQSNIAAFGGDPCKVTIFGESAGAFSVQQLIALPPSPLTFRAAILESKGNLNLQDNWSQLAQMVGCSNNNASVELACMRTVNASLIKNTNEEQSYGFPPVADGITYTSNPQPAFSAGTAAKVPLLLGTNHDEARVFLYILGYNNNNTNITSALNQLFPNQPYVQAVIATLLANTTETPYNALSDLLTAAVFLCATSSYATYAHDVGGLAAWRYRYDASPPNLNLFPDAGAFHSSEIPMVFGTYPSVNKTALEVKLSKYMQGAWAGFAKNPADGPGWPGLGKKAYVGVLGKKGNAGGETTMSAAVVDAVCASYAAVGL